jgi:hypothetical protein
MIRFPQFNLSRSSSPLSNALNLGTRSATAPAAPAARALGQPDWFDASARVGTGGSKWWDRHRPGRLDEPQIQTRPGTPNRPAVFTTVPNIVATAQWHNVAKQRIGELFLTQRGFEGHKQQIQGLFGQLSRATRSGQISEVGAKNLLASLAGDMQRSLRRANFDVPFTELTAPGLGTLRFAKQDGKSWAYFDGTPSSGT